MRCLLNLTSVFSAADEYIPATKRRSQFDSSVLAMREESNKSSVLAMREESNKTSGTIPTYKEGPPEYLNYDNFYPDSKQVRLRN